MKFYYYTHMYLLKALYDSDVCILIFHLSHTLFWMILNFAIRPYKCVLYGQIILSIRISHRHIYIWELRYINTHNVIYI